jgi:hypothetical protein
MESAVISVKADWCITPGPTPSLNLHDSFRRLWFRNLMNCVRFEVDHYMTWDWPTRSKGRR